MPARLSRVPITTLHPASRTPGGTSRESAILNLIGITYRKTRSKNQASSHFAHSPEYTHHRIIALGMSRWVTTVRL
jgi:hypothetical protein